MLSVLNAHPQIVGVDETEFPTPYPFPSAPRLINNRLSKQLYCYKILEHSNKVEFMKKYYPNSKILWPIRHPYGVVSSMRRLKSQQKSWIERCVITEIERLRPFYPQELSKWDFDKLSDVEAASIYWLYKNKFMQILQSEGFDILLFKYEDFLQENRKTLEEIIDFLGLVWSDQVMNYYQTNANKKLAGGTKTNSPLDITRSQGYEGIDDAEKKTIDLICEPLMKNYGYLN